MHSLLVYERGRCGHWYDLFSDLVATHGDTSVDDLGIYGGEMYKGEGAPQPNPWTQYTNWTFFHVKNLNGQGIGAHGTANPVQKYFHDHAIAWRTTKSILYDPSYCVAVNEEQGYPESLNDYEDLAIDAYSGYRGANYNANDPVWRQDPWPVGEYWWGSDERWHWVSNTHGHLELVGID